MAFLLQDIIPPSIDLLCLSLLQLVILDYSIVAWFISSGIFFQISHTNSSNIFRLFKSLLLLIFTRMFFFPDLRLIEGPSPVRNDNIVELWYHCVFSLWRVIFFTVGVVKLLPSISDAVVGIAIDLSLNFVLIVFLSGGLFDFVLLSIFFNHVEEPWYLIVYGVNVAYLHVEPSPSCILSFGRYGKTTRIDRLHQISWLYGVWSISIYQS